MIDVAALARALGYAGALVVVGAVIARSLLRQSWHAEGDAAARSIAQHRLALLTFGATFLLLFAAAMALHHQALDLVDEGETLSAAQYRLALASAWAAGWKAQVAAALLALVAWLPGRTRPYFGARLAPLAALALAATFPLTGHFHALPIGRVWGVLLGALHLLGAGLWLGTLALLAAVGWSGDAEGRGSRVARLIARFSPRALTGAALLALTGVLTGWQTVGSFGALTATPYGRMLLIKLSFLVGVAALGAFNWRVVQPKLAAGTGEGILRRSALIELALGAGLLLATAILVALPAPGLD
ncbi:MAG TPA: CopD family protein [Gemmatimonadales bacterium]|nr:CopD family protein [Gemmatimonadales bacterium]